jgi:hypothetical protein
MGRRRRPHNTGVEEAGSHPNGAKEAGAKQCVRDSRGAGVEETGLSHPGSVGSGAKRIGPNTSARSRAGASDARIRETRAE